MKRPVLSLDTKNMRQSTAVLKKHSKDLARAKERVLKEWKDGTQVWLGCPDDLKTVSRIEGLVKAKKGYATCLVIGIGGSSLGALAAYSALKHTGKGMKLVFTGDTTDPDAISETFAQIDWKKTLVVVIAKSGNTLETMSVFFLARERLHRACGVKAARHIVAITDAEHGELRKFASKEGYDTLEVPQHVGGRFSVLTAVGLFPLACAGIDIRALLRGAKEVRETFVKHAHDSASQFALSQFLADRLEKQHIHVLMPYSARLELLSDWFCQLWAESLGKKSTVGPTPFPARGPADQHSQLQLYAQGPRNKTVTFIEVDSFDTSLTVPGISRVQTVLAYFSGKTFAEIIHAERKATAEALRRANCPNMTLTIPRVTPESIGTLFMFFEIATGIAGALYGISTYDQPGVEEDKKITTMLLSK